MKDIKIFLKTQKEKMEHYSHECYKNLPKDEK